MDKEGGERELKQLTKMKIFWKTTKRERVCVIYSNSKIINNNNYYYYLPHDDDDDDGEGD